MILLALAVAAAAPSPKAEALGQRLARNGTLAALLPVIVAKETDELVEAQRGLGAADIAVLRATAKDVGLRGLQRAMAIEGHAYATLLSPADLAVLVTQAESPAARRQRAVQPKLIMMTIQSLAGMDFKKDALAAFCAKTGKACAARDADKPATGH